MNKAFLLLSLICTLGFRQAHSMESQSSWPWDQTAISQQATHRTTPAQAATRNTGSDRATSQTTRPATTISGGSSSGVSSKFKEITLQPTADSETATTTTTTCPQSNAFDRGPVKVLGEMTIPADSFGMIIQKMGPLTSDKITGLRCVSRTWNQTTVEIDMRDWNLERIEALFAWAADYPNLARQVRSVRCDSKIEDHILSCIVSLFTNIERLNLHYCHQLTANGFMVLARLKKLKFLIVSLTEFDDNALINLANNVQSLKHLEIITCWRLGKNGLMALYQLKRLKSLNILNPRFDENAMINLANNVPGLREINIGAGKIISENTLNEIGSVNPSLRIVYGA